MIADRFQYLLHLADNALIAGHRNSEWTGHGPILEQDIAISNIALDLIGQSRNLYQYAAEYYNAHGGILAGFISSSRFQPGQHSMDEDDLAFLREPGEFYHLLLVEQPNGDWAKTILRQFFFSAYQYELYSSLLHSKDLQLAAIAEKSLKEVIYHRRWSGEWVIRLGDGTEESHRRLVQALDQLWNFTGELFQPASYETSLIAEEITADLKGLYPNWLQEIETVFRSAGIEIPVQGWMQQGGKQGRHTEHLGFLLAEMQYLQRTYPNSDW